MESNQIIPGKNLFGQSNFVSNTFDVLIQLGNAPKQRGGKSPLARNTTTDDQMTKNELDRNAIIVHNSVDSTPVGTHGNRDGELEHVISISDLFEMSNINANENNQNTENFNELQLQTNIGIRSSSASIDVGRRGTNAMQEGHHVTHHD